MGIITLTTDFGRRDPFVAAMKGVILTIAPRVSIVDVVHDLPPFRIQAAAYSIFQIHPWFPADTIHVAVVDPGVGSERAILCARADGRTFIAPDNGLLSYVLETNSDVRVRRIENPAVMLKPVSRTFHGRDILAPAAAHLASGFPWDDLGPETREVVRLPSIRPVFEAGRMLGRVVHVDRFGNLITNIPSTAADGRDPSRIEVEIAGRIIQGLSQAYSQVKPGDWLALAGSDGAIEIARREAPAECAPEVTVGAPVVLSWR